MNWIVERHNHEDGETVYEIWTVDLERRVALVEQKGDAERIVRLHNYNLDGLAGSLRVKAAEERADRLDVQRIETHQALRRAEEEAKRRTQAYAELLAHFVKTDKA